MYYQVKFYNENVNFLKRSYSKSIFFEVVNFYVLNKVLYKIISKKILNHLIKFQTKEIE
jgi:hypothetical protein